MKILLLEDERILQTSIAEFLESIGHIVFSFDDGFDAYEAIKQNRYDLMILDINVPKINGFLLLEKTRELRIFTPVIYISALVDIKEITKGFSLGCSDYIKKPFHLKELSLRIENLSKMLASRQVNHLIIGKNYSYDSENSELFYDNKLVELTKKQSQIIDLFASYAPSIVDFDTLRDVVWDGELVDNATIRAEVARLRKILKEDVIKNIRSLGYRIESCRN